MHGRRSPRMGDRPLARGPERRPCGTTTTGVRVQQALLHGRPPRCRCAATSERAGPGSIMLKLRGRAWLVRRKWQDPKCSSCETLATSGARPKEEWPARAEPVSPIIPRCGYRRGDRDEVSVSSPRPQHGIEHNPNDDAGAAAFENIRCLARQRCRAATQWRLGS